MWAILWMVLTQVPCVQGDSTVVCSCKQGGTSACEVLRDTEPRLFERLEQALTVAKVVEGQEGGAEAGVEAQSASEASEPPDCKGQEHHIISKRIARELELHPVLRGLYKPRDPRFITQAKDEPSHCGYQSWHRDVDEEVIAWLRRFRRATPAEFEAFLRELYSRPAMRARFPNGF